MRPLDPILIGSFPAPPTHIPVTLTSPINNPPPSRPPSTPLPPLPGQQLSLISVDNIPVSSDNNNDDLLAALPPLSRARSTLSVADPIDPYTTPTPTAFAFPRASSPDIAAIISATPRPRAHSLHKSKSQRSGIKRRASEGLASYRRSHVLLASALDDIDMQMNASDDNDTRSWIDHDEFGKPLPYNHFASLERQLKHSDSDASDDSSLDLHTPLLHLMLRHGLLSPQSKLILPARNSVPSTSYPLKDSRDTTQRWIRHRDGKLLKGGIGLTTGLGWSDSKDEDAPSALTRRISSLNLSRPPSSLSSKQKFSTASSSSLSLPSSSRRHPLARSTTTPSLLRASDYSLKALSIYDKFGVPRTPNSAGSSSSGSFVLPAQTPASTRSASGTLGGGIPEHDKELSSPSSSSFLNDTFHRPTHPEMHVSELGVLPRNTPTPANANANINTTTMLLKCEKSLPALPGAAVLSKSLAGGGRSNSNSTLSTALSASSTRMPSTTSSRTSGGSRGSLMVPTGAVRATITSVGAGYTYTSAKSSPDPGSASIPTPTTMSMSTSKMRTPRPLRLVSPPTSGSGSFSSLSTTPTIMTTTPKPTTTTSSSSSSSQPRPPPTQPTTTPPTHLLPSPHLLSQRKHLAQRVQKPVLVPVPVPLVSSPPPSASSIPYASAPPPLSPLPLPPPPRPRPQPRTGTGMVYRSSRGGGGGGHITRMGLNSKGPGGGVGVKPIPL